MPFVLRALLCALFGLVAAPAPAAQGRGQRTLADALAAYENVRELPDEQRLAAVRGLGRFDDERVTRILLAEAARARAVTLQRTVADTLGQRERPGAAPVLAALLDSEDASLRSSAAQGLGRQGEPGVDLLLGRLAKARAAGKDAAARGARQALVLGLSRATSPRAVEALAAEASEGEEVDRRTALGYLKDAGPAPAVTAARTKALLATDLLLAVEGLKQLATHSPADLGDHARRIARRVRDARLGVARAGVVEALALLGKQGDPELCAMLLEAAAGDEPPVESAVTRLVATAPGPDLRGWLLHQGLGAKTAGERMVAIRWLAQADGAEVTQALLAHLAASDPHEARAAIAALALRDDRAAVAPLRAAVANDALRLDALQALARLCRDDPQWNAELLALLEHKDPATRALVLDLLAERQCRDALPRAWRELAHPQWPVRAAACDFLLRVRAKESIPQLIPRVDAESGRLRADVVATLESLTGRTFWTSDAWRRWWQESESGFELPPLPKATPRPRREGARDGAAATVAYYEIPLVSERVAFLIDVSGSMRETVGTDARQTRLTEAKAKLTAVIEAIPEKSSFNVIVFGNGARALLARLAKATRKTKDQVLKSVTELVAAGGTNIHDALETAFADPEVDTIYLLSDGFPSAGKITEVGALAAEVARWNHARRVRIHGVSIGDDSPLLQKLAQESGGRYVRVR